MSDWETTKIKTDVKERAKEDPRTYTEIMRAGLEQDAADTQDLDAVIDELKTELSMAADPAVSPDVDGMMERLERIEAAVQTAEERTGRIESTLEGLQR